MTNETHKKSRTRTLIIGSIVAVVGLGGVMGAQAFTNSRIAAHMGIEGNYAMQQGRVWKTGWGHRGPGFASLTTEQRKFMITRMVKHLAVEIDATDVQQKQLVDLITDFAGEMLPLREKMLADREQVVKLLTAATIDRDALQALRAKKLNDAETISKKVVDAVADAAEILTVEQRKTLAARVRELGEMRGWKH